MGDPGSTSAFYAARPRISLEGNYNDDLTGGLLSLLVEETTEGMFRFEATFGNLGNKNNDVGFLYFDRDVLDFGKKISVIVGDSQTEAKIFEGSITGLEGHYSGLQPPDIMVLAEDRFQDMRMARRTRTFENLSDSDVIRQIASQHSMESDIDIDGPSHKILAQVNQSDLAFIRDRARAADAEVWMDGKTLHARARGRRNSGNVTLTYQKGLREFSVLADIAKQRTSLIVSGWDVASKEGIKYEASESSISAELNGKKSGSQTLQSAFGTRVEQLVHLAPLTDQEAQSLAKANFRRMARKFVTGYGIAEGDGRIRVGTSVDLKDIGIMFDGSYYVTEVRHTFDKQNGYRTHFSVERPGIG
jgi:hypothetical protein